MLIIPYKADLDLYQTPVVTYVVMVTCVVIFLMQLGSREIVNDAAFSFCRDLNKTSIEKNKLDVMPQSVGGCTSIILQLDNMGGTERLRQAIINASEKEADYSEQETLQYIDYLQGHYDDYRLDAPRGLDQRLMFYPDTLNPLSSITSALSHSDWLHIIGNLIFFLAFAPAIEALVGSKWRFILLMIGIGFCCDITYSIVALSNEIAIPSLGLSGVVTGLIGMSAFIMPKARIRTFIWLLFFIWRMSIPAWILALWFIGWDAYTVFSAGGNTGGVNLVAHVSGGIAGYLIGYIWFKQRRDDIADEIEQEVAFSKARSSDRIGGVTQSKNIQRLDDEDEKRRVKREQTEFHDQVYNLVRTEQDSAAVNLIIANDNSLHPSAEIYVDWFKRIGEWRKRRAYLCIGRLAIQLLVEHNRLGAALLLVEECIQVTPNFVLADPRQVLLLAHEAINQHRHSVAYALLRESEKRYHRSVEPVRCGLLEIDLLAHQLNKPQLAKHRARALQSIATPAEKEILADMANQLSG